jgi:uncharacterized protein YndB with AHSA1/START domain
MVGLLRVTLDTITREIFIDAPPPTVWSIVTEPGHMAGWFSDEAVVDLRPGGSMVLTWHGRGTYRGRIETVEPPRTFAFRWLLREGSDPAQDASTLVVMTLVPEGDGTTLRVTESGFAELPWPAEERAHYSSENGRGWIVELDELRAYVAQATGRTA